MRKLLLLSLIFVLTGEFYWLPWSCINHHCTVDLENRNCCTAIHLKCIYNLNNLCTHLRRGTRGTSPTLETIRVNPSARTAERGGTCSIVAPTCRVHNTLLGWYLLISRVLPKQGSYFKGMHALTLCNVSSLSQVISYSKQNVHILHLFQSLCNSLPQERLLAKLHWKRITNTHSVCSEHYRTWGQEAARDAQAVVPSADRPTPVQRFPNPTSEQSLRYQLLRQSLVLNSATNSSFCRVRPEPHTPAWTTATCSHCCTEPGGGSRQQKGWLGSLTGSRKWILQRQDNQSLLLSKLTIEN